jgi:hypothetical protein
MNIGAEIVYQHELYFDPSDARNGSLYLCAAPGAPLDTVAPLIDALRSAGLWSDEPCKSVPETHKKAYAEQMRFVACAQFSHAGADYLAARYDHPKFPSDAARWAEWLAVLEKIPAA